MTGLIEFIRAQLDEDERVARAVEDRSDPWFGQWQVEGNEALRTRNGWVLAHNRGEPYAPGLLVHIVRHDPARVLAEVEAKRRILDAYADAVRMHRLMEETDDDGKWDWLFRSEALEGVVKLLALPYADRPGYREEWRP